MSSWSTGERRLSGVCRAPAGLSDDPRCPYHLRGVYGFGQLAYFRSRGWLRAPVELRSDGTFLGRSAAWFTATSRRTSGRNMWATRVRTGSSAPRCPYLIFLLDVFPPIVQPVGRPSCSSGPFAVPPEPAHSGPTCQSWETPPEQKERVRRMRPKLQVLAYGGVQAARLFARHPLPSF